MFYADFLCKLFIPVKTLFATKVEKECLFFQKSIILFYSIETIHEINFFFLFNKSQILYIDLNSIRVSFLNFSLPHVRPSVYSFINIRRSVFLDDSI